MWRALLGLPFVALLGGIGYSSLFVPHSMQLPNALSGERRELNGKAGRLSYYVAGTGRPLLLIHSVNAAASAYEVRPIFEHYRTSRRVYALDLPGFGFSERGARDYTPRLYTDAVMDMVEQINRDSGSGPIDVLALSLGSEFVARAASENPDRFRSLALISPTAFGKDDAFYGERGSTRGNPSVRQVFEFPLWSQAFFDLLNSRVSQRYFLEKTFGSADVDNGLLEYEYLTAHQPGAQFAPFAFVSGGLFSADIDRVYESLSMPVWLAHGVRGDFTDYGGVDKVQTKGNWTVDTFQTGALPHFEQPDEFFQAYDTFL